MNYIGDRDTRGLYAKFRVRRTDRRDERGEKHENCTYFVLDLMHDKHAIPAILAYACSCKKQYPELAKDLKIAARHMKTILKLNRKEE